MMVFYCDCIGWPQDDVDTDGGLSDMIDQSIEITRKTFMQHTDRLSLQEIEESIGYTKHHRQGLTMAGDWHVSYHRSILHGQRVYYFRHSAIEYVFTGPQETPRDPRPRTIRGQIAQENRQSLGKLGVSAIRYAIRENDPFVTTRVRNWYTE